jgi:hypothetical protein
MCHFDSSRIICSFTAKDADGSRAHFRIAYSNTFPTFILGVVAHVNEIDLVFDSFFMWTEENSTGYVSTFLLERQKPGWSLFRKNG